MSKKFKKVAVGWVSKSGVISLRISEDVAVNLHPQKNLVLFPVKEKRSDKSPDYELCVVEEA